MSNPIASWRDPNQFHLQASICKKCGHTYFPQRFNCIKCLNSSRDQFTIVKLNPKGKIISYTIIHKAPAGYYKYTPYTLAIIQLQPNSKIKQPIKLTGQIINSNIQPRIGQTVQAVYRILKSDDPQGHIQYGIKWQIAQD